MFRLEIFGAFEIGDRPSHFEKPNNSYLDSSVKKRHVDFPPSQKFPIPIPQQATTSGEMMRSDCTRIFGLEWSELRAMMKSARGEPIVAPAGEGQSCSRLCPAPV